MKLKSLVLIITLLFSANIYLYSQEAAVAKWPLSNPDNGGTGLTSTVMGKISASNEELKGTEINQYSGANDSQRIRMAGTGNTWAAGINNQIDTVYVQFTVSPQTGYSFNVSNVLLRIGASSSNYMKANIYYSVDPNFVNPIQINYSTGIANNFLTRDALTEVNQNLNVNVNPGQTFYLRVYPWYQYSSSASGKYVCLQNVEITGLTSSGTSNQLALVTTNASNITWNGATSGGSVLADGGNAVTARGVCWNTTGNPTISDTKSSDGSGIGSFQSTLTGLNPLTKYFVRAYATNSNGTAYGNEITFTTSSSPVIAFPGAEGYGRYTTGGRGGKVIEVTNLNDDTNPGSLRYAINQTGPRIIVFRVSGTIYLKSSLSIKNGNLTIAGQTAPGDGICIAGYTPTINASNVIVRYLRFRLGDINSVEDDAFNGRNQKDIIIDHCSMTWSVDEVASFYDNQNFTMQYCIIGESLYNSSHPKGAHGYGGIQGGMGATFHHNLYIHNTSRNPRFCGARYHQSTASTEIVDFVNNVIYNWGSNSVYGGELGQQNVRANYYKPGPATKSSVLFRILNPTTDSGTNSGLGKFYVADNVVENNANATNDNWTWGVHGVLENVKQQIKVDQPFPIADVRVQTALQAYETVLANVGANFPKRDAVDTRLINDTKNGIATFEGKTYKQNNTVPNPSLITGIIDSQTDVGGWPVLNSLPAPVDTDQDGMPDSWETSKGLNPNDPNDGAVITQSGYSNVEIYLNELVAGTYSSVENEIAIPTEFVLNQNYPNPFNPETKVNYILPKDGFVDIKIYNVQGKVIRELLNENLRAGSYSVTWDGKNQNGAFVSSGVYLFTVKYSNQIKSIKMLLIK